MKLVQLEYFCAVCRYHSITRAAEELYVTQPTISVAIRELEKELKLRLFHHEKNRIYLTQEGEAFYRRADALLRESRAMVAEFSSLGEKEKPIRMGIPPLVSMVFFPSLTDGFYEKTEIPVQLLEYGSVKACNMVQSEELDLALVNMDFYNIDQFNAHVLMEDSYVYCVGREHRYAKQKEVTFEMLGDEKIILFNTDSVQNETVKSRYVSMGITPDVLAYTSQLYTILNFLRGGDCGAFLYSALAVNPRDFVQLPITPRITSKFGIIWKKGVFIPERTMKFIEYLKKHPMRNA
ncbi:MAG: LysR family transcriptional regulator [Eubacteriales bacterium]|nr:LysR family transcriptional regulator [Eubacteriales bacterium]